MQVFRQAQRSDDGGLFGRRHARPSHPFRAKGDHDFEGCAAHQPTRASPPASSLAAVPSVPPALRRAALSPLAYVHAGDRVPVNLSIHYISFSAHSDYEQTSHFIKQIKPAHVVRIRGVEALASAPTPPCHMRMP